MIGCICVFPLYFWVCFFKEKRPQNIYVMSCDVIKLMGTANWSRARSTHGARHQELNQNIKDIHAYMGNLRFRIEDYVAKLTYLSSLALASLHY